MLEIEIADFRTLGLRNIRRDIMPRLRDATDDVSLIRERHDIDSFTSITTVIGIAFESPPNTIRLHRQRAQWNVYNFGKHATSITIRSILAKI